MQYSLAVIRIVHLCVFLQGVSSFPGGAPLTSCTNLLPGHGLQQTGVNPYSLDVQTTSDGRVRVTVQSGNMSFQGFILQGRKVGMNISIGTFTQVPNSAQTIRCTNDDDTVTHTSTSPKSVLVFYWSPPTNFADNVVFLATIAESYSDYWSGISSQQISLPRNVQAVGTTSQVSTSSSAVTVLPRSPAIEQSSAAMILTAINPTTGIAPAVATQQQATSPTTTKTSAAVETLTDIPTTLQQQTTTQSPTATQLTSTHLTTTITSPKITQLSTMTTPSVITLPLPAQGQTETQSLIATQPTTTIPPAVIQTSPASPQTNTQFSASQSPMVSQSQTSIETSTTIQPSLTSQIPATTQPPATPITRTTTQSENITQSPKTLQTSTIIQPPTTTTQTATQEPRIIVSPTSNQTSTKIQQPTETRSAATFMTQITTQLPTITQSATSTQMSTEIQLLITKPVETTTTQTTSEPPVTTKLPTTKTLATLSPVATQSRTTETPTTLLTTQGSTKIEPPATQIPTTTQQVTSSLTYIASQPTSTISKLLLTRPATQTTQQQTTPPRPTRVTAEITITGDFVPQLYDQTSEKFKILANKLETQIENVYREANQTVKVTVLRFRQGSIIADLLLIYKMDTAQPLDPLKQAVKGGKLGDLNVKPDSVKFTGNQDSNTIIATPGAEGSQQNSEDTDDIKELLIACLVFVLVLVLMVFFSLVILLHRIKKKT